MWERYVYGVNARPIDLDESIAWHEYTEAKAIWTELAKDEGSPMAAEARVRLGELEAEPMKI